MIRYNEVEAISRMNALSRASKPFVFFIDYDHEKIIISEQPVEDILFYDFLGHHKLSSLKSIQPDFYFDKYPISYNDYLTSFDQVKRALQRGDSYLVNLAFPTLVKTNLGLEEVFVQSEAKFKAYVPGEFVFFSPEQFVDIIEDKVYTYPMKGTIDSSLPDAEQQILNDSKEMAEHSTVVDLLRNDLSQICAKVRVKRFRYIERVVSHNKELLQVSSEITGRLLEPLSGHLGDILFSLLPAGSITGAPKTKTLEIINKAEITPRGYYTGICGYYDGKNLRSGVMIRMIQLDDNQNMYYYSGGGITVQSDPVKEYQELIDKVYVPIIRDHQNSRREDLQCSLSQ